MPPTGSADPGLKGQGMVLVGAFCRGEGLGAGSTNSMW